MKTHCHTKQPNSTFRMLRGLLLVALALAQTAAFAAPPAPVDKGGFTLAVIPDSQHYTWKNPEIYEQQTRWIAANIEKHNIVFLLHVGDITQHNKREHWENARKAHAAYSGRLPAAYVPGNHDLGERGKTDSRQSYFSEYIPLASYREQPGFGGVYDREPARTENSWHTFDAGGRSWLVLALEFAPRDDVLRWAGEVVATHPKHSVIVITHAYMRASKDRYDRTILKTQSDGTTAPIASLDKYPLSSKPGNGGFNDAGDMWRKFISQHANIALVLCGHTCTSAHLESKGKHGNTVQQVLVDYQSTPNEKNGWFRLLQFQPDGLTVRVRDYTPLLDETSGKAACKFDFKIAPPPAAG